MRVAYKASNFKRNDVGMNCGISFWHAMWKSALLFWLLFTWLNCSQFIVSDALFHTVFCILPKPCIVNRIDFLILIESQICLQMKITEVQCCTSVNPFSSSEDCTCLFRLTLHNSCCIMIPVLSKCVWLKWTW